MSEINKSEISTGSKLPKAELKEGNRIALGAKVDGENIVAKILQNKILLPVIMEQLTLQFIAEFCNVRKAPNGQVQVSDVTNPWIDDKHEYIFEVSVIRVKKKDILTADGN